MRTKFPSFIKRGDREDRGGVVKIKKFILGFGVGLALSFCIYFVRFADVKLHIDVGRLLDQDIVYMKDGTLLRGWVVKEGAHEILIETEKGNFPLPRSRFKAIEKDVFLKFVRKAI